MQPIAGMGASVTLHLLTPMDFVLFVIRSMHVPGLLLGILRGMPVLAVLTVAGPCAGKMVGTVLLQGPHC